MSRHVAYKRSKTTGNWIKSSFGAGCCFTLSYDRLEQLLKEHNMPICRLSNEETIERVEIDSTGITVFIELGVPSPAGGTRKR